MNLKIRSDKAACEHCPIPSDSVFSSIALLSALSRIVTNRHEDMLFSLPSGIAHILGLLEVSL